MKSVLINFADRRVILCNALEEEHCLIFTSEGSNNWTRDREAASDF